MEFTETVSFKEVLDSIEQDLKIDDDEKIELISKALSSQTRRDIIRLIRNQSRNGELIDVSSIAGILNMTEANISAQIKRLEKAGLIRCYYMPGHHGVKKISQMTYKKIIFSI